MIDIDKIIDYKAEYAAVIKRTKVTGHSVNGLCPFHPDSNASFSADIKTGQFNCFACGAKGNYIQFVADLECNGDTKEAYRRICEKYRINTNDQKPKSKKTTTAYGIEAYAAEKHLPLDWLVSEFQLSNGTEAGDTYVRIPYFDEQGNRTLFRKRFDKQAKCRFKWGRGAAGKLIMYGEWRLARMRERGFVILVEGESDTQTLWHLGHPALGVPGATVFKSAWIEKLKGLKLYIHVEPDSGGKVFRNHLVDKLVEADFKGEIRAFSCGKMDVKDPSELLVRDGKEKAAAAIQALLDSAEIIDLNALAINDAMPDAPKRLKQPTGWHYSDNGIEMVDKDGELKVVCRTPIILTRRLKSVDTGDEKIEIAFKRDGEWSTHVFPRSVIFQSKSITALSDLGCTVTSENAKTVVKFLEALEAENIDLLERQDSTSTFGWQPNNRFLPGHADDMVLDIEPSLQSWAAAYSKNGSLKDWVEQMQPLRAINSPYTHWHKFRFILSSAFTAPILKLIKQRIFIVYNWGDSKGGKTAALKCAASVWGDPERLMVNFNATQVALERMAGFFCDLPLCVDERQLAGGNQDTLEKIIYMLSSGTGRARGSKGGGLQTLHTWRTVALMTGEEPIAQTTSKSGVVTRMIEILGAPFKDELAAGQAHKACSENCGWAGVELVGWVMRNSETFKKLHEDMTHRIMKLNLTTNSSHLSAVIAVATVDMVISEILFGAEKIVALKEAELMAKLILTDLKNNELPDVNASAANWIVDFAASNPKSFTKDPETSLKWYGWQEDEWLYIVPSVLQEEIAKAGYSFRKTMAYLNEIGAIKLTESSKNQKNFTVVKRLNLELKRVYAININKIRGEDNEQILMDQLIPVKDDEILPF